jgi:hypothetical protein
MSYDLGPFSQPIRHIGSVFRKGRHRFGSDLGFEGLESSNDVLWIAVMFQYLVDDGWFALQDSLRCGRV